MVKYIVSHFFEKIERSTSFCFVLLAEAQFSTWNLSSLHPKASLSSLDQN